MNTMKHTKGNWFVSNSGGTVTADNKSRFTAICTLETVPLKITEEVHANAKLIAAAPELLESLESIAGILKFMPEHLTESGKEEVIKAFDAINKATL